MVSDFALSALLLSMLGVYGVVSYSVRQRTPEMGTRMALGATGPGLLRMVLLEGLKMAGTGVAIGLALAVAVQQILSRNDFGLTIRSPWPILDSVLVVSAFTLLACWFPAWRATLLSPMVAIRNEPDSMWERTRERYQWLARRVSTLVAHGDATAASESALLSEIVDASRSAESFPEAIQQALTKLCEAMRAESATLLVQGSSDQPYRLLSALPETTRDWSLPAHALLVNRLRNYQVALPLSAQDLQTWSHWAKEHAPARAAEIATLLEIAPAVAVPVMAKTEVTGILLLGSQNGSQNGSSAGRHDYSSLDKRLLRTVASQLALLLENARLTDRIVEQERLRRELLLASEVQKRLFPEGPLETTSLQLAGFCLPARGIGGDYYDFLNIGKHKIGIALADVAGKGIAAALVMSIVQASLRSLAEGDGWSLAELAGKVNRLLHRSTGPSSYATFFYAQFDEETRQLRYVNAGHNPPFLLRNGANASLVPFVASNAPVEELATGGLIIGMFSQSIYEEGTVQLHSGDVLMAFTDGVSEAHNPKQEEYGEDRIKDLLRRIAHLPIEEMSARVLAELRIWMADAPQHDDLTFVLMKVH